MYRLTNVYYIRIQWKLPITIHVSQFVLEIALIERLLIGIRLYTIINLNFISYLIKSNNKSKVCFSGY